MYNNATPITPNDSTPLANIPNGIYVGGAGDIVVQGYKTGSANTTFKAVPVGTVLPFRAQFVRATGTTATNLVALY